MPSEALLRVENLKVHFPVRHGLFRRAREWVKAVDDVSFSIDRNETVGLVGESGCGKTTLGRAVVRLADPTGGKVFFEDQEISNLPAAKLRPLRRNFQIIFQDPYGSLDPRMTIEDTIGEALDIHRLAESKTARRGRVAELLVSVVLDPSHAQRYPHEF